MKTTPLFLQHQELKAKMVLFSGWRLPLFYSSIISEYRHCREMAVIFDVSHMGKIIFEGDISGSGIEEAVTPWIEKIPVGKSRYGFILNQQGGVIDDLIVLKLKENKLFFVVNAVSQSASYTILKQRLKKGNLKDVSSRLTKIDLQGPLAREVLGQSLNLGQGLPYFNFSEYDYKGKKIIISRTGYTGELGYELFLPNSMADFVWKKLLAQEKIKPAGLGARDMLRIEMGYSLCGQELTEKITPFQAGLGGFIDFRKNFIGKDFLLCQKKKGADKEKIAFSVNSKRIPRPGYKIYSGGREIGQVTSGALSLGLASGIGLGYVEPGNHQEIKVGDGKQLILEAEIKELPFYKKGSLRN